MMTSPESVPNVEWQTQPQAARLVSQLLSDACSRSAFLNQLGQRLRNETGTRLLDWIHSFVVPNSSGMKTALGEAGYQLHSPNCYRHEGGLFPDIYLGQEQLFEEHAIFLKVESVADFLFAHGLVEIPIEGEPFAVIRRACVDRRPDQEVWVIESHGQRGIVPSEDHPLSSALIVKIIHHAEKFRLRPRHFTTNQEGFQHTLQLVRDAIKDLGANRTCDLFFAAERAYWQSRNRAARVQKARQDQLGMGWANHDHHTYRSSRSEFHHLIKLMEEMGFVCRERFYAGKEAGWGAQVIEHPETGIIIFADVDLSPEEVTGDFAHHPLPERNELGTVGLWCALHGEALLQAGMHHLECQFDFDAAREQLKQHGIETMKPFTDFPYLRQAFTQGEIWKVSEHRLAQLLEAGKITPEQANKFRTNGALGSHLEILERNDGYKGFNQTGINEIILKTDPRKQSEPAHA